MKQIKLKNETLTIPSCFHCPILAECTGMYYCNLNEYKRVDNWNIIQDWCPLEDDKSYLKDTDEWKIKYGKEK